MLVNILSFSLLLRFLSSLQLSCRDLRYSRSSVHQSAQSFLFIFTFVDLFIHWFLVASYWVCTCLIDRAVLPRMAASVLFSLGSHSALCMLGIIKHPHGKFHAECETPLCSSLSSRISAPQFPAAFGALNSS